MNLFKFGINNDIYGNTYMENLFINEYLPDAPGSFLKVYILGMKFAQSNPAAAISNETIAKILNLTREEVMNAWAYWEEKQLINIHRGAPGGKDMDYMIEFVSLKELKLDISYKQEGLTRDSADRIISARKDPRVRELFDYLRKAFGRELSSNEMFVFLDWMEDYSLPPDVIRLLVDDCLARDKKDLPYLKQVAKNWFDAGIDSVEKAKEYARQHREKWQKFSKVLGFLRVGRQPTSAEEEMMYKWFYTYGFEDDVVMKACELTAKTIKPSFTYIDKILEEWRGKNIKSLQEAEAYLLKSSEGRKDHVKTTRKNANAQKPGFNNFANRSYDTKLLKEQLLKKGRGELSD